MFSRSAERQAVYSDPAFAKSGWRERLTSISCADAIDDTIGVTADSGDLVTFNYDGATNFQ